MVMVLLQLLQTMVILLRTKTKINRPIERINTTMTSHSRIIIIKITKTMLDNVRTIIIILARREHNLLKE